MPLVVKATPRKSNELDAFLQSALNGAGLKAIYDNNYDIVPLNKYLETQNQNTDMNKRIKLADPNQHAWLFDIEFGVRHTFHSNRYPLLEEHEIDFSRVDLIKPLQRHTGGFHYYGNEYAGLNASAKLYDRRSAQGCYEMFNLRQDMYSASLDLRELAERQAQPPIQLESDDSLFSEADTQLWDPCEADTLLWDPYEVIDIRAEVKGVRRQLKRQNACSEEQLRALLDCREAINPRRLFPE